MPSCILDSRKRGCLKINRDVMNLTKEGQRIKGHNQGKRNKVVMESINNPESK